MDAAQRFTDTNDEVYKINIQIVVLRYACSLMKQFFYIKNGNEDGQKLNLDNIKKVLIHVYNSHVEEIHVQNSYSKSNREIDLFELLNSITVIKTLRIAQLSLQHK